MDFIADQNANPTKNLTRYYLQLLGATIPEGFMAQIEDGDVVEIYNGNSKRLFFSQELFNYSSYSPDEMYSTPWWKLYSREPEITKLIAKYVIEVCHGTRREPFCPDIPIHAVQETSSALKYTAEVHIKLFAPVFVGETIIGIAALERFKLLSTL